MNDQSSKAHEMDVQLKAKTDGISLKVKGAGVFVKGLVFLFLYLVASLV